MTTTTDHHAPLTSADVGGIGHSVKRAEDDRLIQGAGNFLDDIVLPGMLHMAIVRSELPHAKILSIDSSEAEALDGVIAVVTGEMLAGYNLAWMPTPLGRHPGGPCHRQGAVPGPGSGRGNRHRPLHR